MSTLLFTIDRNLSETDLDGVEWLAGDEEGSPADAPCHKGPDPRGIILCYPHQELVKSK